MSWDLEKLETSGKIIRAALTPHGFAGGHGKTAAGKIPVPLLSGWPFFAKRLKVDKVTMTENLVRTVHKRSA